MEGQDSIGEYPDHGGGFCFAGVAYLVVDGALIWQSAQMRRNLFTNLILLCALGLCCASAQTSHFPMGCYFVKGESAFPIVSAEGGDPVAIIDGEREQVSVTEIIFSKVPLYAEGFIEVSRHEEYRNSMSQRSTFSLESGAEIPTQGFIDIEFTPTADYSDLYALVVSGSESALSLDDPDGLYLQFTRIGGVQKGRAFKESLKAFFPYDPDEIRKVDYAVLFFDQGSPVLSSLEAKAYEHFRLRRLNAHEEKLRKYLAENFRTTVKQKAYSTFIPYLPKELYNEVGSVKTKVIFKVSEKGLVEVESFSNLDHPKGEAFIREAMKDWFFYPKLDKGFPVATRTATMIEF